MMRRAVRIASAIGVVAFGLTAPALPGLAVTCAGATVAAAPAATIRVAVVVDDGTGAAPRVDCITVPAKERNGEMQATGAAVIAARASQLGLTGTRQPRWSNGLLCAIDGYPDTGCVAPTSAGYFYWSYWQGQGDRWVYSSLGPAYRYVKDGAVEGWRHGNGGGSGQDRTPRVAPAAARCPTLPPSTPPTTAPPAPPPPNGSGTGGGPSSGTGSPTTRPPDANRPGAPSTVAPADTATTVAAPAAGGAVPPSADSSTTTTTTTTIGVAVAGRSETRAAATSVEIPGDDADEGGWAGTAVGVGALGAAAIGLTVLGRRRRAGP